jgi:hypothetical protein
MDKHLLVNQAIERLRASLISQGYKVGEYRTIPRYIGFRPFPVEVAIVLPDSKRETYLEDGRHLSQLKRTLFTEEEQKLIGVFLVYPSADAMNEDMDERLNQHLVVSDW